MLRRIAKILAYTAAALTVLLAIAVGLWRSALPQVPEYRDEIIARLRSCLEEIIADPSALPGRAAAARARALSLFTWAAKAEQIRVLYDAILQAPKDPPPQIFPVS